MAAAAPWSRWVLYGMSTTSVGAELADDAGAASPHTQHRAQSSVLAAIPARPFLLSQPPVNGKRCAVGADLGKRSLLMQRWWAEHISAVGFFVLSWLSSLCQGSHWLA